MSISCSKGTYIRSLAYDLGEQLGYGAHLTALLRTRSGPFLLSESITLEQVAEAQQHSQLTTYLIPADRVLQDYPAIHPNEIDVARILHGNAFRYPGLSVQPPLDLARIYDTRGRFIAIANWDANQQVWQPKKVFTENT